MPVDHYENFPVASWLLPARLRPPVEAIYAFARGADDIADEGEASDADRLAGLARYTRALDEIEAGATPHEAPFARIAWAIREYALPVPLLRDLIDAFSQDVVKKRYATFAELMDYSRRSANPVGRLLLHLFEVGTGDAKTGDAKNGDAPYFSAERETGDAPYFSAPQKSRVRPRFSVEQSDNICSALQLINFWQDVAVDWQKGRVYIPQEDLARFDVDEAQIASGKANDRWRALMAFECSRARDMLNAGAPLGRALPGRVGLEIRATVQGGLAIADKIDAVAGDVFRNRPVLGVGDWTRIALKLVSEAILAPAKSRL